MELLLKFFHGWILKYRKMMHTHSSTDLRFSTTVAWCTSCVMPLFLSLRTTGMYSMVTRTDLQTLIARVQCSHRYFGALRMAAAVAKPPAKQRVVLMPLGGMRNKHFPKPEFRRQRVLA